MASLDTMDARTSLPPAFAWSQAYSFATSVANFFAMPAVPDAAAEVSIDADDNETFGTAAGVATGAAGATTVNERPGPNRCGTVARIVWPDDGTLTSNCDPGGLSGGQVTLTRWTGAGGAAGTRMMNVSPGATSGIAARAFRPSGICTTMGLPA